MCREMGSDKKKQKADADHEDEDLAEDASEHEVCVVLVVAHVRGWQGGLTPKHSSPDNVLALSTLFIFVVLSLHTLQKIFGEFL